jgi:hypothetical protein
MSTRFNRVLTFPTGAKKPLPQPSNMRIDGVEGTVRRPLVALAASEAAEHPEKALGLIRRWLGQD